MYDYASLPFFRETFKNRKIDFAGDFAIRVEEQILLRLLHTVGKK